MDYKVEVFLHPNDAFLFVYLVAFKGCWVLRIEKKKIKRKIDYIGFYAVY